MTGRGREGVAGQAVSGICWCFIVTRQVFSKRWFDGQSAFSPVLSFSEGDCTGSLGWPYRVHRTADTTCSVVVCTSRREGMGLLRSPLHEAVLRRHFTNHKHPLYALDRRTG